MCRRSRQIPGSFVREGDRVPTAPGCNGRDLAVPLNGPFLSNRMTPSLSTTRLASSPGRARAMNASNRPGILRRAVAVLLKQIFFGPMLARALHVHGQMKTRYCNHRWRLGCPVHVCYASRSWSPVSVYADALYPASEAVRALNTRTRLSVFATRWSLTTEPSAAPENYTTSTDVATSCFARRHQINMRRRDDCLT